ncbi:unnamed protein product [Toxocara canis]|uniref:BED-type domain-containing protein n=1 Tax=Toxocara canis TaxID=6265 RepID=A0A183VED0_TOXCA|nr:unnamed protein product [Toxocara canis]
MDVGEEKHSCTISSTLADVKEEGTNVDVTTMADALNALSGVSSSTKLRFFDRRYFTDAFSEMYRGCKRGRTPEHPCWEMMERLLNDNCMICRLCSKRVMWINTRNAMQHLKNCNPSIAEELERIWQSKLQLRADVNKFSEDSFRLDYTKKRGRTTEHPSWFHFDRVDKKGANCKLCGVRVAYACSGNLMKHLKSRHVPEFVVAQKEWDDILRKKKQLCEIRLMAATSESGDNSPQQDFPIYDVEDDGEEVAASPTSRSVSRDGPIETPEANEDNAPAWGKKPESNQSTEKDVVQEEQTHLETTASACAQPIPGTVMPIINGPSGNTVNETVTRILQSMGVPTSASSTNQSTHDPKAMREDLGSPLFAMSSTTLRGSGECTPRIGSIAKRRIQSFVNVLAEDLASFPLEKSLLYMRQIRKYMDERLVESESFTFNSEDDANIG